MVNSYDIFMDGEAVGTASLEKEGLYWKIRCRCDLPGEVPHQITLKAGEEIDLGLLVKEDDGFCLTKRIAMKRFGNAYPSFLAKPRITKPKESFHSIVPDKPFAYIERIKDSNLEEKNGELGIILVEEDLQSQIPDNDLSLEFQDGSAPEQCDHPDL